MFPIDSDHYQTIKGYNKRIRFLVLHFTAANFASSVTSLTRSGSASVHYLVPDPSEQTYKRAGFKEMRIFKLLDENDRAWHAGVSSWSGRSNLNDTSIGIEIVNLATDNKGVFNFPDYHPDQIEAVKQLALDIVRRYPDITPTNVVAHSDISVGRKSDPGPKFPWKLLFDAGIGAWYADGRKADYVKQFANKIPDKSDIIKKLKDYGYDTSSALSVSGYRELVRAFQLHYRPSRYDGIMDIETAAILWALHDKYVKKITLSV